MIKGIFKSIRTEMAFVMGLAFFVTIGVLIFYSTTTYESDVNSNIEKMVLNETRSYTQRIKNEIEGRLFTARFLAQTLSSVRDLMFALDISRSEANTMLMKSLRENKSFVGVYAAWEPDVIGQDTANALKDGCDDLGRYLPYYSYDSVGIEFVQPLKDFEPEGTNISYPMIKSSQKEYISEPYAFPTIGLSTVVISLVSPIICDSRFYGIVGVNNRADFLQSAVEFDTIFGGKGQIAIISNQGTLIAVSNNRGIIGEPYSVIFNDTAEQKKLISEPKESFRVVDGNYVINQPLVIGSCLEIWQIRYTVTTKHYLAIIHQKIWTQIILGFFLLLLTIILTIIYVSRIISPLRYFVNYTRTIARGELDFPKSSFNKYEIGHLNQALSELVSSLKEITNISEAISNGDFSKVVQIKSKKDFLGQAINQMNENLKNAKDEEELRKKEDWERNWINKGIAQINDILRQNNNDINELAHIIVKYLVQYLNANQGGLFVYSDENKDDIYLEQVATFAYNHKKYMEKRIKLGEGLVGACAIEKTMYYINDLPDDYIEIESGLGDSNPHCLLVVPMKLEEIVLGVIEIASFHEIEKFQIEFIEKSSDTIAVTLSSAKINAQTKLLLEQSQQQSEEMADQEREMRSNLEELRYTQEEAVRKEIEMRGVLNAINVTSFVIEFDIDGKILTINNRMLELFGKQSEQMLGHDHREFSVMSSDKLYYDNFWEELRQGKSRTEIEHFVFDSKKEIWLSQTFTPIIDREGNPFKILNIAVDITETKLQERKLQKQAQDMQVQEREIRQTMKDMFETQEVMIKKELHLSGILQAIDQTALRLECDSDGVVTDINPKCLELMNYNREDLLRTNIRFSIQNDNLELFEQAWLQLTKAKSWQGTLRFRAKGGHEVWLMLTISPVCDNDDNILKVLILGFDISEQRNLERRNREHSARLLAQENELKQNYSDNNSK